ncbi:UNVERIFIED_CONTAM: RNA-binding protein 39 [Sesamum calycinum]|uniref:RNA-binding protein 39 n=1 Tax=Sesamum calycinum TaxID=2727403 RepID=A0AAW2SSM1_9LAMI
MREREREESRLFELAHSSILNVFAWLDLRRFKDKKEAVEPEADPERDQRTVFAYQMPLKATERDVFEFFSQAGKVRDVKLIMDRNSRRSKGVGYIEFYDAMSVPMAIALSGHLFLGQPVMVKPSEAEKNLVQSNTSAGGAGVAGPYGATDRKLYVGNLHFNMTEFQLKQIFEAFGPVELVQLPTDPETGHCKGFGFVQVSSVTDHVGVQDSGAKTADLMMMMEVALNAQSRAMLMAKLDRSGIASRFCGEGLRPSAALPCAWAQSGLLPRCTPYTLWQQCACPLDFAPAFEKVRSAPFAMALGALGIMDPGTLCVILRRPLGVPALNGAVPSQQAIAMPINPTSVLPTPVLPAQVVSMAPEPIGTPSDPEFDLDIRDDVQEECSKYGRVKHIHVDNNLMSMMPNSKAQPERVLLQTKHEWSTVPLPRNASASSWIVWKSLAVI